MTETNNPIAQLVADGILSHAPRGFQMPDTSAIIRSIADHDLDALLEREDRI